MTEQIVNLSAFNKQIKVNAFGAELISFKKEEGKNVLWEKTSSHWNRVAPLLFPIVGKLKDNSYSFEDKEYSLTQHGFLRDQQFLLVEQTENSITFEFNSNPLTKAVFPFDFTFQVCYSLDENGLKIEAKVQNNGDSKMYFSYGGHPAFHLEDELQNYSLRFQKDFEVDRHLIEDGLFSGEMEKMIISGNLDLSDELFHSDAIVFKQPPFQEIELLHNTKGSILTMKCETWNSIGIWTKPGAPFLCLEPWWGWADSANTNGNLIQKAGIRMLEKGESSDLTYHINPS